MKSRTYLAIKNYTNARGKILNKTILLHVLQEVLLTRKIRSQETHEEDKFKPVRTIYLFW